MTRRDWLAAAGVTLAGCESKRQGGYPGAALIAVSGETALAVVDLLHFRLRDPIPLGAAPSAVIPMLNGRGSYVLTPSTGSVHLVNAALEHRGGRKLADELSGMYLSPLGNLLAVSASSREIIITDGRTLAPVRRIQIAGEPMGMDVSRVGEIALSLAGRLNRVTFIGANGAQHTAALDGQPGEIRFRADGKRLIVARPADRMLTVLSVPDLNVLAHLPLAMEPRNLCFTPDGGQLFVTGPGMDGLAIVFLYNTLEVEQTILAGRTPGSMACVRSPEYLLVANSTASAVSVLSVPTRKLIALVGVGLQPRFITVTPDSQYALILDEGSGDMAVVHVPAIKSDPSRLDLKKRGAALFTLLPVGSKPVQAAVVPYTS